ncbi:MAG: PEP-CTERM sorting domain-containing protein [Planctomycetia bacterium]|nr:PEP-CTERM sorting domain-containing protein [Planctomycetia bacterium]
MRSIFLYSIFASTFVFVLPGACWGEVFDLKTGRIHSYSFDTDYSDGFGTSDGTATGAATIATGGQIGGYLSLTGGYVTLANSTGTNFGVNKTMGASMWSRTAEADKWAILFANGDWESGENQGVRYSNCYGTSGVYGTNINAADGTNRIDYRIKSVFSTNSWQFLGFSLDVDGYSWVYYGRSNGYFVSLRGDASSLDDTALQTSYAWHVGADGVNNHAYTGDIDELNVWNRELTPQQAFRLYAGGLKGMSTEQIINATAPTTTIQSGAWNDNTTWNGSSSPLGGESVTVAHEVTFSSDATIMSNVTLVGGGKFNFSPTNWLSFSSMNFVQNGGETAISSDLFNVGNHTGDETNIVVNSGAFSANIMRLASNRNKNDQTNMNASLTLAGDSTFSSNYFVVGFGSENKGYVTIKNSAVVNFNAQVVAGVRDGYGELNIQDNAQVSFSEKHAYFGSLGVSNDNYSNGVAVLNVRGGNVEFKGNLVLGEGGNASGTFNMSGGTVSVVSNTELSRGNGSGILNFSGGSATLNSLLFGGDSSTKAELNRIGGLGTLSASSITMSTVGVANFLIDATGMSALNVSGTANLAGTVAAKNRGGLGLTTASEYCLIEADAGISNFTATDDALWNTRGDTNQIWGFLNPLRKVADFAIVDGTQTLNFPDTLTTGWFSLPEAEGKIANVELILDTMPDATQADLFLEWLSSGLFEEGTQDLSYTEDGVALSGIALSDTLFLSWDLEQFNSLNATAFAFSGLNLEMTNAVPEPSTWALVLLGAAGLAGLHVRNSRRKLSA